ncbi:unnamed protein product [Cyclocybe aegerita]|uniref:Uncharacterized protein n=1 Tax=Cyclocybe aegerita TaxID=1973307 RepID=A0A8S0WYJ4_CYCAE|nr:unnamed protein product [Cyclocybe aegerita]
MARRVDDRDPAIIYSTAPPGQWDWASSSGGFPWGAPEEYMGTTTLSRRKGARATFSFVGSSVQVYGTISINVTVSASSSYAIDGGAPTFYTAPVVSQITYQTPFFQSRPVSPGRHTLVIQNEADEAWFWFDYIAYTPADETPTSPTNPSAPSPTSTSTSATAPPATQIHGASSASSPSSSGDAATGISPSSQSPSSSSFSSNSRSGVPTSLLPQPDAQNSGSNNTAAIIGGSIGAAIVIAVLSGVLVWMCMRQRQRRMIDAQTTINANPFTDPKANAPLVYPVSDTSEIQPVSPPEAGFARPYHDGSNTSVTPFFADSSVPATTPTSAKSPTEPSRNSRTTFYDPPPMYQRV